MFSHPVPGVGVHSNMKVTGMPAGMCLLENENIGHSAQDFVEKRGSLGVRFKKKIVHFWCKLPKIGVHSV